MTNTPNFISSLPRPFVIYGMGITGKSILKLLKQFAPKENDLIVYDDKLSNSISKQEILMKFSCGTIVLSPGVPISDPFIQSYLAKGGQLTSELEIAFSLLESEKIICVTGSIGKSTTSALITAGLSAMDPNTFLGGNFGIPLADYIYDRRNQKRPAAQYIVLELSSYQLENFKNLKSDISVITYLTQNHMDRYDSKADYYNTKLTLVHKTSGPTVCNRNGGDLESYLSRRPFPKIIWTNRESSLVKKHSLQNCKLLGLHNLDNLDMSAEVLNFFNAPDTAFEALKNYSGLSHRFENIGEFSGVLYINDSKSTTIESVHQAIQNVQESYPNSKIYILLGGRDKGLPWMKLSIFQDMQNFVFVFFGECRNLIVNQSGLKGASFESLGQALDSVFQSAKAGDIVLLSPGGTSLDEFSSFEVRGDFFKNEILKHSSYSARQE